MAAGRRSALIVLMKQGTRPGGPCGQTNETAEVDATASREQIARIRIGPRSSRAGRESQMYHFDCAQRVDFASLSEWFKRYYPQLVDDSAGNSWGFVGLLDQLLERWYVHVLELLDVET